MKRPRTKGQWRLEGYGIFALTIRHKRDNPGGWSSDDPSVLTKYIRKQMRLIIQAYRCFEIAKRRAG